MFFIAKPGFTINRDGNRYITDKEGLIDCPKDLWEMYRLKKIEVIEERVKVEIKEQVKPKRKTK